MIIIRGASLVVWAIKDGRDAIQFQIQKYLEKKEIKKRKGCMIERYKKNLKVLQN